MIFIGEKKKIKFENKFSTFFHSFLISFIFLILFRQSGSGKSSFISSIIREKSRLLKPSPTKVIWIYNKYYKDYHEVLSQSIENIEFSPTFDYETIMGRIELESQENYYLLILDDILQLQENLDLIFTR